MSAETGCFYVPLGEERFWATELTATPWGTGSQHGGPPAVLLGRALESDAGGEGGIFARLAFEILGPIPEVGYHQGIEARFVEGSWREPGNAAAWVRMRVPLLPDEEPSPLVKVLVVA